MSRKVPTEWLTFREEDFINGAHFYTPEYHFDLEIKLPSGKKFRSPQHHVQSDKIYRNRSTAQRKRANELYRLQHVGEISYTQYTTELKDTWDNSIELKSGEIYDIQYRYVGIDLYNKIIDDLKPGDFIQFKGQRDAESWRKIIRIDWSKGGFGTIFGHKYSKPIDDEKYDMRHSSENAVHFIKNYVSAEDAVNHK